MNATYGSIDEEDDQKVANKILSDEELSEDKINDEFYEELSPGQNRQDYDESEYINKSSIAVDKFAQNQGDHLIDDMDEDFYDHGKFLLTIHIDIPQYKKRVDTEEQIYSDEYDVKHDDEPESNQKEKVMDFSELNQNKKEDFSAKHKIVNMDESGENSDADDDYEH